jgi:hypothetical protein
MAKIHALPRESSRVAGLPLVVECHCFMSFDGAKDQTPCAIDASARSEKAMEIQAKRQGLLPYDILYETILLGSAPRKHPLLEVGSALPDFLWLFHSPFGRLRAAPHPKAFGAGPPIARASAPDPVKFWD